MNYMYNIHIVVCSLTMQLCKYIFSVYTDRFKQCGIHSYRIYPSPELFLPEPKHWSDLGPKATHRGHQFFHQHSVSGKSHSS